MDKIVVEVGGHKYISIDFIAQEIDKWSKRIAMGNDNYRQLDGTNTRHDNVKYK